MADDIREALTRLAEPVVPRPDPYHRLLVRVRRRRQRRTAVAAVAGLAAVAVAMPVIGTGGLRALTDPASSPPPAAGTYQPASRVDKPMVRRLLDSPTRGNLAGDTALIADIERQYRAAPRPTARRPGAGRGEGAARARRAGGPGGGGGVPERLARVASFRTR
ncbi:hypothetical protein ABGB16_13065 [Micromonospora sp. B11E3]|uniref:hypothetical protein n=1 Tax=Micromonospora sp. B11E3 TaxID=3153562 RepID=UPI00325EF483